MFLFRVAPGAKAGGRRTRLFCYKARGLAATPGAGPGRRRDSNTRYKDDDVVGGLARIRGISLVSSGDPIIHMWIISGEYVFECV